MSEKTIVDTGSAPGAVGPYSQAVKVGDTVYLSGQIPLDPQTMTIVEGGIEAETRQVFHNLGAVAEAAGGTIGDIVKLNIFLTDLGNFDQVNTIMAEVFNEPFPARACVEVSALPKGATVEMEAILVL